MKSFVLLFTLLFAASAPAWADPPNRPLLTLGLGIKGYANDATQGVVWARVRALKHASLRGETYASVSYAQPTLAATYDILLFNEHITLFAGPGYTYNNDGHRLYNPELMAGGTLRLGRLHLQACAPIVFRHTDTDKGLWVGIGYGF